MLPENQTPIDTTPKQSSAGPVSGIIIILALLLFGALYFWGVYESKRNAPPPISIIPGDEITENFSTTSTP